MLLQWQQSNAKNTILTVEPARACICWVMHRSRTGFSQIMFPVNRRYHALCCRNEQAQGRMVSWLIDEAWPGNEHSMLRRTGACT